MRVTVLTACVLTASCADIDGRTQPRRQITECPDGLVLICESQRPPARGGAEEDIPLYDHCRCEPIL